MRLNEFKMSEEQIRQKVKSTYPHLTEEQLDEIIPAVAAGARVAGSALARGAVGAAKLAGKAAVGGAKLAGKTAVGGAKLAAKGAGKVAGAAGRVGAKMGNKAMNAVVNKAADKANKVVAQKLLKPGATIPIAGNDMKVDAVKGREITLADPKTKNAPKLVFDKDSDEIKTGLQTLTQRVM